MTPYTYLLLAIVTEVIASTALRATQGFTRLAPSLLVIIGYAISFYALSRTLEAINLGVVYAIWSGVGMVLVTLLAFLVYDQKLDLPGFIGIALIILGVLVINIYSKVTLP